MSPVEKGGGHAGRALAVSGVAIAVVGVVLWAGAVFANRQSAVDVKLGDSTFQGGDAERLAAEIDDRGPILYGDISDGNDEIRDIILQHVGDDPDEGWVAFRAQPPGEDRECTWVWDAEDEVFRAGGEKCDEDHTAPADAEGLEQYPVTVEDGKLDVDLNDADRPDDATTSTAIVSGDVPDDSTTTAPR